WALSGGALTPLNPPLVALRNYDDIARKNIFVGPLPDATAGGPEWPVPADEVVNVMKFTRFIGLIDDGRPEAKLWDYAFNMRHSIKATLGFNRIPLLRTGKSQLVVYGDVKEIVDRELVFRVTLNYGFPRTTKWWRYPKDA